MNPWCVPYAQVRGGDSDAPISAPRPGNRAAADDSALAHAAAMARYNMPGDRRVSDGLLADLLLRTWSLFCALLPTHKQADALLCDASELVPGTVQ